MKSRVRWRLVALVTASLAITGGRPAMADRPSAPELLPINTVAMARVADVPDLIARFKQTSLGRIANDKKVQPFLSHLYGSAVEAFGQIEGQVGLSLNKLLSLPQGELVIGVVAPEQRTPALVFLIDVGDSAASARKLLERGAELLEQQGARRSNKTIAGQKVTVHEMAGEQTWRVVHFIKDKTVVLVTDLEVAEGLLERWEGKSKSRSLADNGRYTTIMKRCAGPKDQAPQLTWFIEPMELIKSALRDNASAQAGLALAPVLGLDGLKGIGGGLTLATEKFDMINHVHVLLDSPRTGVIEMLALDSGDLEPEPWVPENVANYTTLHWDIDKTYSTLKKLYDSFTNEGAMDNLVQGQLSEHWGINFEKDFLGQLDGRVTWLNVVARPATVEGNTSLLAIKLKDGKKFEKTLATILDNVEIKFEKSAIGKVKIWKLVRQERPPVVDAVPAAEGENPRQARRQRRRQAFRMQLGFHEPALAIMDDYLLLAGRSDLIQQALLTATRPSKSLATDEEYKTIADEIKRHVGSGKPGLMTFSRPEEGMRMMYDLLTQANQREQVSEQANNPATSRRVMSAVEAALKKHPLPPFSHLAKYLAPSGAVLTNEETGFHYVSFALRRE